MPITYEQAVNEEFSSQADCDYTAQHVKDAYYRDDRETVKSVNRGVLDRELAQ